MIVAAMAASTMFRTSVDQPTGSECSCPKQWQFGVRPRARFTPIATTNTTSRVKTPIAPQRAVAAGISAIAQASSAIGSSTAIGRASIGGNPKSTMRPLRARTIDQFRDAREREDARQHQPSEDGNRFHTEAF